MTHKFINNDLMKSQWIEGIEKAILLEEILSNCFVIIQIAKY